MSGTLLGQPASGPRVASDSEQIAAGYHPGRVPDRRGIDPPDKPGLAALTAAMLSDGGTREMTYKQIVDGVSHGDLGHEPGG